MQLILSYDLHTVVFEVLILISILVEAWAWWSTASGFNSTITSLECFFSFFLT